MNNKIMSYASNIRRLAAACIDGAIISLIGISISYALGTNPFVEATTNTMTMIDKIFTVLASAFYFIGFWVAQNGQTPGKRMMKIRIVKEDGKPIDLFTGIIRYIGQWVSSVVLLLGYVWIFFDGRRQGWHDKLARTLVLNTEEKKPNGCVVALGCIFPMLLVFCVSFFGAAATNKERIISIIKNMQGSQSFSNSIKGMRPEAKTHYDVSQKLFTQLREASNNQDKIIELNNENITELKKALEIDSSNSVLLATLASAYTWPTTNGTINDGIVSAKKALELEKDNARIYTTLGILLYRSKQYDEAVLELQKAIRIDEKNTDAHFSIARAYAMLRVFDTARIEYQKAIDLLTQKNKSGLHDETILMLQKESAALPK